MTRYLIYLTLLLTTIVFAWVKGGQPERAAAIVIVSIYVMDPIYHAIWGNVTIYEEVNLGHLFMDVWLLVATTVIALRAQRVWPLWLVSVQLVAIVAHFLRWISPQVDPLVYAVMTRIPTYLQIALLFIGTELHRRRLRRGISSPSWRRS